MGFSQHEQDRERPLPNFGDLLRSRREARGLTQQVLADHATLSVRALRDLEAERVRYPRNDTVRLLADALRLEGRARTIFEASARRREDPDGLSPEPSPPPTPRNSLIGRQEETEALVDALTVDGARLLSVVGLGGVGKSRLALEVAHRVHERLRWSVRWPTGADPVALRGTLPTGPTAVDPARTDALDESIGDRPTLLVLDDACPSQARPLLDRLFRHCPGLRVLVTAREPLTADGEQVVPLQPLPVPEPQAAYEPDVLAQVASVRMLVAHLRTVRPGFRLDAGNARAVAELCRLLDGLPRALEYAAGWILVESPEQLVTRLSPSPWRLAAPPVTHVERGHLRADLDEAMAELSVPQRSLLAYLAAAGEDRSAEQAGSAVGLPLAECLAAVHEVLHRGLVRTRLTPGGVRFSALSLVRTLMRDGRGPHGTATGALPFGPAGIALGAVG
ncbi:Predicted ATPase [Actinacidiphila rubida]|uniref:Predicted ATPase n=2 Tax=Actinacidiphila rubida TaxID=310780 RepID=A0A1H8K9V4_9ACTN|nr:helix-turn-helix domain-containing protein [Actinacidiphila rubida]SEN89792.1 Predicted ATPase [Actinacidiphila rubida]